MVLFYSFAAAAFVHSMVLCWHLVIVFIVHRFGDLLVPPHSYLYTIDI